MVSAITNNAWIARPRPRHTADVRLFCFPYAGGGSLGYRRWADEMMGNVEVCPIQLPGRESQMRAKPFERVQPLVQALAPALRPYLDQPFAFFGHSMGALIAFEMAREIRRRYGVEPLRLYVSARVAPHLRLPREPMYLLPDGEFMDVLRELNGTPREVLENEEMMRLIMPLLRADFAVNEAYTYTEEEPLTCPIFALGGLRDPEATAENMEPWRRHTRGEFKLQMFPGDHFFINAAQTLLLRVLSQDLASRRTTA